MTSSTTPNTNQVVYSPNKYALQSSSKALFGGNREAAIDRDGGKCVWCGMTREQHWEEYKRDITVDHIDGRGVNSAPEDKNNDMSNLQTLCVACHMKKDNKSKTLTDIQVINIRHAKGSISGAKLAKMYGVTPSTIYNILNNRLRTAYITLNDYKGDKMPQETIQDELYLLVYADDGTPAMGGGSSAKKQLRVFLTFEQARRGIERIRNDNNRKIVIRRYTR